MRFRAVMMTSIAFILGLLPLVIATGAAEISRRAVGTAVFAVCSPQVRSGYSWYQCFM
jgi:multidrug efflux pump subunit AcrB